MRRKWRWSVEQHFAALDALRALHLKHIDAGAGCGGIDDGGGAGCATTEAAAVEGIELPAEGLTAGSLQTVHALGLGGQQEIVGIGLLLRAVDACCIAEERHLRLDGGTHALDGGPTVGTPYDAVEIGDAACIDIAGLKTVIEQPGLAGIVGDELGAVSRSVHLRAGIEQGREVVACGRAAIAVDIGSEEIARAGHHQAVGALGPLAACACRADEVIVVAMLDDHRGLDQSAGYLSGLGAFFQLQSVGSELHAVDVVEGAEEEPAAPVVILYEEGVDAVLDADLAGNEELVGIVEAPVGAVADGYANAAVPRLAPLRLGIVEHVLAADIVDVGCPDASVGHHVHGACGIGEGGAGISPGDQVARAVDGHVVRVLGGIEVEVAVLRADDGGVGQAPTDDGVLVGGHLTVGTCSDDAYEGEGQAQETLFHDGRTPRGLVGRQERGVHVGGQEAEGEGIASADRRHPLEVASVVLQAIHGQAMVGEGIGIALGSEEELVAPAVAQAYLDLAAGSELSRPAVVVGLAGGACHLQAAGSGIGVPPYGAAIAADPYLSGHGQLDDVEHTAVVVGLVGVDDDGALAIGVVGELGDAALGDILQPVGFGAHAVGGVGLLGGGEVEGAGHHAERGLIDAGAQLALLQALAGLQAVGIGEDHVEAGGVLLVARDKELYGRHLGTYIARLVLDDAEYLGRQTDGLARQRPACHHRVELVVGERERGVVGGQVLRLLVLRGRRIEAELIAHLVGGGDGAGGPVPGEGDGGLVGNAFVENDLLYGGADVHLVGVGGQREVFGLLVAGGETHPHPSPGEGS